MVLSWLPIVALLIEKTNFPTMGDLAIYAQLGIWTLIFLLSLNLYRFNLTLYLFDVSLALPLICVLNYPLIPIVGASVLTITFHRFFSFEDVTIQQEPIEDTNDKTSLFVIILMGSIMTIDLIAVLFLYPYYSPTVLERLSISVLFDLGDGETRWTGFLGSGDFLALGVVYTLVGQRPLVGVTSVLLSIWIITNLPITHTFSPATVFILTLYFCIHSFLTFCERRLSSIRNNKPDTNFYLFTRRNKTY